MFTSGPKLSHCNHLHREKHTRGCAFKEVDIRINLIIPRDCTPNVFFRVSPVIDWCAKESSPPISILRCGATTLRLPTGERYEMLDGGAVVDSWSVSDKATEISNIVVWIVEAFTVCPGESNILDRHNSKIAEEAIEWLWIDRILIEKAIVLQTRISMVIQFLH